MQRHNQRQSSAAVGSSSWLVSPLVPAPLDLPPSLPLKQDRIVANTDEFVVVSKPAGVPAAATVDNLLECAPTCAAQVGPCLICSCGCRAPGCLWN